MKYFILLFILLFPSIASAEDDPCASIDTEFKMYDCLATHYEEVEKKLMVTYDQALYQLDKGGEEQDKRKKLFMDSQHNWISYRETTCLAETFDITDEKKAPLMMRLCYMRLAERRIEDIEEHYQTWEKKRSK